jgi:hypothetical protein
MVTKVLLNDSKTAISCVLSTPVAENGQMVAGRYSTSFTLPDCFVAID